MMSAVVDVSGEHYCRAPSLWRHQGAGRRGAVVEDDFYNKLEKLNVQAGKRGKILLAHVQRICEAHDTVLRSYYQQIHGSSGADATTSMENIGGQVCV